MEGLALLIIFLFLAPFFSAIIQKVKAFLVGKHGPPLFINYFTLAKLLTKGSVYSASTTFIFRLSPVISLVVSLMALFFMPLAGTAPVLSFQGDVILVLYLFGLARFFTICAALDTASPFEGMGAAREAYFAFLCEAAVFTVLVLFYRLNGALSLAGYFTGPDPINLWRPEGALLLLVIAAMFMVLLAENSRVPVDDPATHLELTMIHEVMVLDHSGPDLAIIELGAFLKLFFYAAFIANLILPSRPTVGFADIASFFVVISTIYVIVGVIESITARSKMGLVPKFILTSFALAFFATILVLELK